LPAHDLPLLIDAARMAGRVATSYVGTTAARWDKPGGAGPVTEADLAVNTLLEATLRQARPDYGWLSEESDDNALRLSQDRVFIIDPIDGTRSFVEGSDTWAHSIAVAEHGQITAAVVYLPLLDRLYAASLGGGARLNNAPIPPDPPCMNSTGAVAPSRHSPAAIARRWPIAWRWWHRGGLMRC
jgi:myo-inositol-1(or 4)-monophosphatase